MLEVGTRVRLDESKIHPCWSEKKKEEWCSHEGVVIGYGVEDEQGTLLQIAWSEGCNHTLHIHECNVVVIGDASYEDRVRNLDGVFFDRSDSKGIIASPPLGKWRCKNIGV